MHELEEYRGIQISINDEGRFVAEFNGSTYRRASLASLKKKIDDNSGSFDALVVRGGFMGVGEPRRVTIIGPSRRHKSRYALKAGDGHVYGDRYEEYVFPFDQATFDYFEALYERQKEIEKEYKAKCNQLQRVTRADL